MSIPQNVCHAMELSRLAGHINEFHLTLEWKTWAISALERAAIYLAADDDANVEQWDDATNQPDDQSGDAAQVEGDKSREEPLPTPEQRGGTER